VDDNYVAIKLDRGLCAYNGWTFPGINVIHMNPDFVKAVWDEYRDACTSSSGSTSGPSKSREVADHRFVLDIEAELGGGSFRTSYYDPATGSTSPGPDPTEGITGPATFTHSGGDPTKGKCECLITELASILLHEMAHVRLAGEKEAYLLESYYGYRYEHDNGFGHSNCCKLRTSVSSWDPSDYDSKEDAMAVTWQKDPVVVNGEWRLSGCGTVA
jgi:hypothetical protein